MKHLIFVFLILFRTYSFAAENCTSVVGKPSYLKQVIDSRGLRLFLKPSEDLSVEKRWGGLIRHIPQEQGANEWHLTREIRYLIKTLPLKLLGIDSTGRYEMTPFKALYEQSVVRPTHWVSSKLGQRKMEPAFFSRLAIITILSVVAWNNVDQYYASRLDQQIVQNIQAYSVVYDSLIQNDFRYDKIRSALNSKKIDRDQARQQAFWQEVALSQYVQYRSAHPNESLLLNNELKLLKHALFNHLQNVIEEGVKPNLGFTIQPGKQGPLSDSQKLQLFQLNHALQLRYELIKDRVNNTLSNEARKDPEVQKLLSMIESSSFAQKLFNLKEEGKINSQQLIRALQEEAYWQTRFAEWETIGVIRLKFENGSYTDAPLTLNDIRLEILEDLKG